MGIKWENKMWTKEMRIEFHRIWVEHQERILWIGQPIDTNPDWEKNLNEEFLRFNEELMGFDSKYKEELGE